MGKPTNTTRLSAASYTTYQPSSPVAPSSQKRSAGHTTAQIMRYWIPELISLFIIVALPPLFDAFLMAHNSSAASYATLGLSTNFIHMLIKFSEAIPVASIAIIGRYNGAQEYNKCGQELVATFWTTLLLGMLQFSLLFFGAAAIYRWLGLSEELVALGTPFLRIRAFSLLLAFILWSFIGFMRAVKNTQVPMAITLIGTMSYLWSSYAFIPHYGLYGAAYAAVVQYSIMLLLAVGYLLANKKYRKYFSQLTLWHVSREHLWRIIWLSIPIMIDKSALSFAYVWLSRMIVPMGTQSLAMFDIIKNLERSAIMPAAAFAHVVTFLVSNALGENKPHSALRDIKKIMQITSVIVISTLCFMCINAERIISLISPEATITPHAVHLLRVVSFLVVFDFIQLILAAALRGAGKVHTVMWGRFISCIFFFVPLSYILSGLSISSTETKFGLIYGAFYLNTALMGAFFWFHIMRHNWYKKNI